MMKNSMMMTVCAVGTGALLLCGCGPELAQTQLGTEEEQWQSQIRQSYPSWRPPRSAPPATFDNHDPDFKAAPQPAETDVTVQPKDIPAQPDTVGIPAAAAADAPAAPAAEAAAPAPAAEAAAPAPAENAAAPTAAAAPAAEAAVPAEKAAAPAAQDEVYTVQKGDSISRIARKVYGDGRLYWPILKANPKLKDNPNRIYPGMKLTIPKR